MDSSQNFENKKFPRHKSVLRRNPLSPVRPLIFLFLLTISRPPGVCLNKKSPSHFCTGVLLIFPTILLVWVAWVSSRRSSRTGPLTPHSCTWPSRSADQPCAAFPAPSDTASSLSRH